jgi:hypothetical protein
MKTLPLLVAGLAIWGSMVATNALAASSLTTNSLEMSSSEPGNSRAGRNADSQCVGDCARDLDASPRLLSRVEATVQEAESRHMFEEPQRKDSPRRKIRLPLRLPFGVID